jgi:hypothetical protein
MKQRIVPSTSQPGMFDVKAATRGKYRNQVIFTGTKAEIKRHRQSWKEATSVAR